MNIIILFESDKKDDGTFHLVDSRAEHIRKILKSQINDRLEIGILNGKLGTALIQSITDKEVALTDIQLDDTVQNINTIDIIIALPRPQTVKKVLFISAMMGVRNIFLIRANRVEKSFFHSIVLEKDNLQKHLIDGLQQGKKTQLPIVSIHDKCKPFIQDWQCQFYESYNEQPIMLLPDLDTEQNLSDVIKISGAPSLGMGSHLLIAIGPEGGWVPYETEMMTSLGFQKFKLGDWTLRVEHALTACLAQVELLK